MTTLPVYMAKCAGIRFRGKRQNDDLMSVGRVSETIFPSRVPKVADWAHQRSSVICRARESLENTLSGTDSCPV